MAKAAALSVADRSLIWRELMKRWSRAREPCSFSKWVLYKPASNTGAIADVDIWLVALKDKSKKIGDVDDALSVAMRLSMTEKHKVDLLNAVTARRDI